jgi:hypothetical protein
MGQCERLLGSESHSVLKKINELLIGIGIGKTLKYVFKLLNAVGIFKSRIIVFQRAHLLFVGDQCRV